MKTEIVTLCEERNVTLTAYLQEVGGEFAGIPRRPAALILPGGGYSMCADLEADPVAFPFLKAGYQVFVLRYSVGEASVWPNPLEDYEAAAEMIRRRAGEWKVCEDRMVVIGFSAGGHLAACAATMAEHRPNAAILGYPVIDGECARGYQKTAPDVIGAVNGRTCPCFVFAARTDNVVPVKNTLHFLAALEENDVAFESHIYSNGPHGFSLGDASVGMSPQTVCSRVPHWVADSLEWLKDVLGDFGDGQMTEPRFGGRINGNHDPYLNIDCTLGFLFPKPEAMAIVQPVFSAGQGEQMQATDQMDPAAMMASIQNMTLRQMLEYAKVPEEVMDQFQTRLSAIKND